MLLLLLQRRRWSSSCLRVRMMQLLETALGRLLEWLWQLMVLRMSQLLGGLLARVMVVLQILIRLLLLELVMMRRRLMLELSWTWRHAREREILLLLLLMLWTVSVAGWIGGCQPVPPPGQEVLELVQLERGQHPVVGEQVKQVHNPGRGSQEAGRLRLGEGRRRGRHLAQVAQDRVKVAPEEGHGVFQGHVAMLKGLLAVEDSHSAGLVHLVLAVEQRGVKDAVAGKVVHGEGQQGVVLQDDQVGAQADAV